MTITFLDEKVANLKFNKVGAGEFFIESDVQEIANQGYVQFTQRGYVTEVELTEPQKQLQIYLPILDPTQKKSIEESLE